MTQSPSLATAFAEALEARLMDLHVSVPGIVTEYDALTQKVSVQPVNMLPYLDEFGERRVGKQPIIMDVPVLFPGSGDDGMTFPIQVGDTVKLLFSESSLAQWLRLGGVFDPADDRKHSLSDAVALVGLRSFVNPIANVPTNAVVIRCSVQLRLGSATASDPVARKSDLVALKSYIDNHKHGAGTFVTPGPTAVTGTSDSPTASAPTPVCSPTVVST